MCIAVSDISLFQYHDYRAHDKNLKYLDKSPKNYVVIRTYQPMFKHCYMMLNVFEYFSSVYRQHNYITSYVPTYTYC